jgi:hypothetical protein
MVSTSRAGVAGLRNNPPTTGNAPRPVLPVAGVPGRIRFSPRQATVCSKGTSAVTVLFDSLNRGVLMNIVTGTAGLLASCGSAIMNVCG